MVNSVPFKFKERGDERVEYCMRYLCEDGTSWEEDD